MADRTISQLDPGSEPQADDLIPVSRNSGGGLRGDYHVSLGDLIAASTNTADEVDYDNASSGLSAEEVQSALDELQSNKVGIGQKGAINGVATLDATGVIPTSQIPPLNITNPFVIDTEVEMLALSAQVGDVAIRTDTGNSYILAGEPASTLSNWKLITASGAVTSVFGRVGVVAPQSGDYTSDQVGYDPGASGLAATTTKAALDELASEKMDASLRRAVNGVAGLDNAGKIYLSELPTDKLTRPHLAADQAAMIALSAEVGDLAIRSDLSNEVFVLVVAPASEVTNWVSITGVGAVTAADVSFDGATSGLSASNLQDAIDALVVNKVKTTAGEAITAGNGVVIRKSDGKAYRVNASNALMMEDAYLTGVAESTASTGQEVLIHFLGPRAGYGSYSGGTILYASDTTPGQMVSTAPANAYMIGLILPGGVLLLGSLGVSQSASTGDGDVPMEPQNLSVSHLADATAFTITWDVPGSNGGKTITKYIIKVLTGSLATYPGYPVDHIDMGNLSHTTVGSLNEGETYTIQIQAHNVVGTGLLASTTYKIVNAPEVPQNLVISHTLGQVALSLTWQAPANNHGEVPTSYTVTVKDSLDQVIDTSSVAGLTYTTPNTLLEEELYTVELFATNSGGDSAAITDDYTILNVPGDITDLAVVTAVNDVDLNVTWTAPVGGATVQTYRVVITPDAGGAATVDATVNHPTTSYTAVALAYGVYDIAVTAQNSGDVSNPVSIDAFTHEASGPGVPQNLVASTSGQDLTVDWDAPASGGPVETYEVSVQEQGITNPAPENTILLLHGEGVDGATTIVDSSSEARAITRFGSAQIDTAQFKFGAASVLFNGTTDYLTVADSDDLDIGTGDFHVTVWVRPTASSGYRAIFYQWNSVGGNGWYFALNGNTAFHLSGSIDGTFTTTATLTSALTLNTWHLIEVTRVSGVLYLFANGVQQTLSASGAMNGKNVTGMNTHQLGAYGHTTRSEYFAGHMDEFLLAKTAGHTAGYTPTATPYAIGVSLSSTVTPPTTVESFADLPTGSYDISVLSRNAAGDSAPVTIADYGHGVPSVTQNLSAISSGQDLAVDWDAPATGDVDEYEVTISQEGSIGDASTLLVINSDTTNGSTTFVDSSDKAHAISRQGNTVHSTTQKKFGASSIYFDGVNDYLLITAPNSGFEWGTGNYRIGFWMSVPNVSADRYDEMFWIGNTSYTQSGLDIQFRYQVSELVLWSYNATGGSVSHYFVIPPGAMVNNTFAYFEITRVGGQMYVSIDGVQLAIKGGSTRTNSHTYTPVTRVSAGVAVGFGTTGGFIGYLDNIVVEAKAGNTTNFTPPTEPLPGSGVTVIDTAIVAAPTTQATFVALPFDTYDVSVVARNESGDSAAATLTDTVHI